MHRRPAQSAQASQATGLWTTATNNAKQGYIHQELAIGQHEVFTSRLVVPETNQEEETKGREAKMTEIKGAMATMKAETESGIGPVV